MASSLVLFASRCPRRLSSVSVCMSLSIYCICLSVYVPLFLYIFLRLSYLYSRCIYRSLLYAQDQFRGEPQRRVSPLERVKT